MVWTRRAIDFSEGTSLCVWWYHCVTVLSVALSHLCSEPASQAGFETGVGNPGCRAQLTSSLCFNRLTKFIASPMNPCTAIAASGVSWKTRLAVRVSML